MYHLTFTYIDKQNKRMTLGFIYEKYSQAASMMTSFGSNLIGIGCIVLNALIETK